MYFGLINALYAFMDMMNRVFKTYLDSFVIVSIDNILIYSKNGEEHKQHLSYDIRKIEGAEVICQIH